MKIKMKQALFLRVVFCCVVMVFATGGLFCPAATLLADTVGSPRYLRIELHEVFQHIDMPFALFDHELHSKKNGTEACEKCHSISNDGTFKSKIFDNLKTSDLEKLTADYHDFCNRCHGAKTSSPLTCKQCHNPMKLYRPARWIAPELTLLQHEKVALFVDGKCGECHHGHTDSKPAVEDDFEYLCRACHLKEIVGKIPSMRTVAHERCITCHIKAIKETGHGGPMECVPCHPDGNVPLKYVGDMSAVERLDAGQKDVVYIHSEGALKPGVMFNHRGHEEDVKSCGTCHHKGLQQCSNCHTFTDSSNGGGVALGDAFMEVNTPRSCVGCHERQKKRNKCTYCHSNMAARATENSCNVCHTGDGPVEPQKSELQQNSIYKIPASLPVEFVVGEGADDFKITMFPHTMIIQTLSADMAKSQLATRFHGGIKVVCEKCHHKTNETTAYEKCATCHQNKYNKNEEGKTSLSDALTSLCVECHPARYKKTPVSQ